MGIETFVQAVQSGNLDVCTLQAIDDCGDWFVLDQDHNEMVSGTAQEVLPVFFTILGMTVIDAAYWEE